MLRDYQDQLLSEVTRAYETGAQRVLATMATGGGKTRTAAQYALKFPKVLWVAHRQELIDQAAEALKNAGHRDYALQSVFSEPTEEDFDLLVMDECHHAPAASLRRYLDKAHYSKLLGLTATPYRLDRAALGFDAIVYGATLDELTKAGHLVPIDLYTVRASESSDVTLINWMYSHPNLMKKAIVFVKDKDEARFYQKTLSLVYKTEAIFHESDRREILKRYQHGDTNVLVSIAVLTEGTDLPCTTTIVLSRKSESESLLRQMVGRAVRLYEGKTHCNVIQAVTLDRSSTSISSIITPRDHYISSFKNSWLTVKL